MRGRDEIKCLFNDKMCIRKLSIRVHISQTPRILKESIAKHRQLAISFNNKLPSQKKTLKTLKTRPGDLVMPDPFG